MVIDKIGNINNIYNTKKSKSVQKNPQTQKSNDSIQISNEGLKAAEEAKYLKIVQETPDIRKERVQEIKAQIDAGTYDKHLDDKVISMVADRLLGDLTK